MKTLIPLLASLLIAVRLPAAEVACYGAENVAIPSSTPASDFIINNDGTVTHRVTGLTWMRCIYGMTWNGVTCEGERALKFWMDALAAGNSLVFAGHNDWRLPNLKEMLSILEERCEAPSINAILFPGNQEHGYWTSTSDNNDGVSNDNAQALIVIDGVVFNQYKGVYGLFRLVRGTAR